MLNLLLVILPKINNTARKVHNYRLKIMISNYAIPRSYSILFLEVCVCLCEYVATNKSLDKCLAENKAYWPYRIFTSMASITMTNETFQNLKNTATF